MKIHSLGYVVVNSTNPAAWSDYGTKVLGMMDNSAKLNGEGEENVYLKMDDRPYRFFVQKADVDNYAASGWEIAGPDNFADALATLEKHGVSYEKADAATIARRQVQDMATFKDPDGNVHEIFWGAISDFEQFASPVGINSFVTGTQGLGHTVLPCPNFDAGSKFYTDVMGFQMADLMKVRFTPDPAEPEKRLWFMHCNERHHSLAIFEAEMPTNCVHVMVETDRIDEVGRCLDRIQEHNVPLTGTLGRHANDHMVSFYMLTPSFFMLEYGADGMTVEDWDNYSPFQSTVNSFWGHDFSVGQPPAEE